MTGEWVSTSLGNQGLGSRSRGSCYSRDTNRVKCRSEGLEGVGG